MPLDDKIYAKYFKPNTVQHLTSAFNANPEAVIKASLEIPDLLQKHKYKMNEVLVASLVTATAILMSVDDMIAGSDDAVEKLKQILKGMS